MGKKFLIDTNILIYFSRDEFPGPIDKQWLLRVFVESFRLSIITKIEFLGWQKHTVETFIIAEKLLEKATVYYLDDSVAEQTIRLRRRKSVKLADAIIAATCMVHDLILITGNDVDFAGIDGLKRLNPFTEPTR